MSNNLKQIVNQLSQKVILSLEKKNLEAQIRHNSYIQNMHQQQFAYLASNIYYPIAGILKEAIDTTAKITSIVSPQKPEQLYHNPPFGKGKGGYYLQYKAYYTFTGKTAKDIGKILQTELNSITSRRNLPYLVVRVVLLTNDMAIIQVALLNWVK